MSQHTPSHSLQSSLQEWLCYLEHLHSQEIELGLSRIGQVASRLNINFDFSKVITVAGTNGKGTSCAFLENALLGQGKSVAVYSSPHIERFNERLRVNKVDCDDQAFIRAFVEIEQARGDISLSYYEFTTLAAFLVLMGEKPDVIILEVGLGGRLDATNIIDADIAVITTVDLDHQAFLGDTREAIGYEKAGIMRANTPVVVGDKNPPQSLLDYGDGLKANIYLRDRDFFVSASKDKAGQDNRGSWQWRHAQQVLSDLTLPFIPQDNVATALMVLSLLDIDNDNESELNPGLVNALIDKTRVPGRTEMFHGQSDIMLDVGHNPQAARYLADVLVKKRQQQGYTRVLAVVGMLADKDITNSLKPLASSIDSWYLGTLEGPRAATAGEIAQRLTADDENINCFDNVTQAFKMACNNAKATDLILVFGSFFTVAEIRRLLV